MLRQALLAATVSGVALLSAGAVSAQTAPNTQTVPAAAEPAGVDDIVVTAQRRSENIRDVPFAVTALSPQTLQEVSAGGADILSLSGRVPACRSKARTAAMRRASISAAWAMWTSTHRLAAGVGRAGQCGSGKRLSEGLPLFDVQQLEVLRGPQGTLFGRNTPAGVVKIDTVKPSDEFTGFGSLTYGNLGSTRAEAAVTLPASDTLQVRGAILWNHRDDWVNNAYNPSFANPDKDDLGGFDDLAARVHVAWTPTDRLSTLLTLQARDYDGTGTMNRANALTKGSNKLNDNFDRDTVYYDGGRNNFQKQKTTSESLQVAYDFGPATLTGIVGSYQGWSQGDGDIDGGVASAPATASYKTPFNSETGTLSSDLLQNTYELRLASNGDGGWAGRWAPSTGTNVSTWSAARSTAWAACSRRG